MKRLKKVTTLLLCIILVASLFAACGHKKDDTNNIDTEGIDVNKISNGCFTVTVPDSWEGKYGVIIDDETIQLYQKAAYESFGGGHLCSFAVFNDEGYKELPDYEVLISGDKTYIVMYPTDVQADIEDEESTAEYFEMFDQLPQVVGSFEVGINP